MMKESDIDAALSEAMARVPKTRSLAAMTRCDVADTVYAFIDSLKERAGWPAVIGLRAVHGLISKWRRAEQCP